MSRAAKLMEIVTGGQSVLMDGALGTELERRGLPLEGSGWSAQAVRDYGEVIEAIHRDYIEAGARLHIANSFALDSPGRANRGRLLRYRTVAASPAER